MMGDQNLEITPVWNFHLQALTLTCPVFLTDSLLSWHLG